MLTTALAIRALAQNCLDEGLVFSVCAQMSACQVPLWQYGTPEQQAAYLEPLISGRFIGSSVITEPEAGSDSAALSTAVLKTADGYELHGIKTFATLAPEADCLLVYGKHSGGIPALDVSAFILKRKARNTGLVRCLKKWGCGQAP